MLLNVITVIVMNCLTLQVSAKIDHRYSVLRADQSFNVNKFFVNVINFCRLILQKCAVNGGNYLQIFIQIVSLNEVRVKMSITELVFYFMLISEKKF